MLAGGEATGAGDGEQGTKGLRAGSVGVHGQNLHPGARRASGDSIRK